MIILATQGTGKSYAASKLPNVTDVDRKRGKEALQDYIERLLKANNDDPAGYVLGNARHDIAEELVKRGIEFKIFAPFKEDLTEDGQEEVKERIFGRIILRKTQTSHSYTYIEDFKVNYEKWNSKAFYKDIPGYEKCINFIPVTPSCLDVLSLLNTTTYC